MTMLAGVAWKERVKVGCCLKADWLRREAVMNWLLLESSFVVEREENILL